LKFIFGQDERDIPQGLKPPGLRLVERPKAKALGYLEAKCLEVKVPGSKSAWK
jgi:hypothetical protein